MSIGNQFVNLLVGMKARTSKTTMDIQNLRQAILLPDADFNTGTGVYTPSAPVYIHNWQTTGSTPAPAGQAEANPWSGHAPGGRDWAGAVPTATWLALYLVSDGTNANTYCVWSQDFQVPNCTGLRGNPTYHCYIGANYTHESASEFKYSIIKCMRRSYYVGGGEVSLNGGLPLICSGTASKWTNETIAAVLPPTAGPLGVVLRISEWSTTTGTALVAIAPNRWFADPSLYIDNVLLDAGKLSDMAIQGELLPDQGSNLAYWSNAASGKVYANYFDDPQ